MPQGTKKDPHKGQEAGHVVGPIWRLIGPNAANFGLIKPSWPNKGPPKRSQDGVVENQKNTQ
jgi:hypothetical protein